MERVFELDFLVEADSAPIVGWVELFGAKYALRRADVLQDFLIVLGAIEEQIRNIEEARPPDGQAIEEIAKLNGRQLLKLRDEAHRCIHLLVPDLPQDVLLKHFGTLTKAQQLFNHLIGLVEDCASDSLKKNSAGASTESPTKSRKRSKGRAASRNG